MAIAINRSHHPGGYIGSAVATLNGSNYGGDMSIYVPPIIMGPPNLKIWATRRYQGQGLLSNSDEQRRTISNEGAATTTDPLIEIHSLWLDQDGSPLPSGLTGYGYTGRITKLISNPDDGDPYDNNVTEFDINPGRQLQVLQFDNSPYHHYIQVNGSPSGEQNDFSTGDLSGPLRHRPSRYVPIKVPLYDEQGTVLDKIAASQSDNHLKKSDVSARFNWLYRPELSFSIVDLEVGAINLQSQDENGNIQTINLRNNENPVISSGDDLVQVIFNLIGSEYDRITPLDGEQHYIFALGDQEIEVNINKGEGSDQQIQFTNLDYPAQLESEDYLTLSLYLNQDAQNTLWAWGFDQLDVIPPELAVGSDSDVITISADDAALYPETILAFLANPPDDGSVDYVRWQTSAGDLTNTVSVSPDGLFATSLKLPTKAGSVSQVQAYLNDLEDLHSDSAAFETRPGAAAKFTPLSSSGSASIAQQGSMQYRYGLKDAFGNKVADGTPVTIVAEHMLVNGGLDGDTSQLVTNDGEVSFTLQGDYLAGTHNLTLKSGDASYETQVSINDITIELTPLGDIQTGNTVTVEVTASGDAEGLNVKLAAQRGSLGSDRVVIQNGKATTSMYVGDIPGSGYLFARLGEQVTQQAFNVVEPDGSYLLDTVLVKDAQRGSFTSNGKVFEYTNATQLRVAGTPGEQVSASLHSLTEPMIDPLLSYDFTRQPQNGVFPDAQGNIDATDQNTRSGQSPAVIPGSTITVLEDNAAIAIAEDSDYLLSDNIGFSAQLKADSPGQLIQYGGGLTLALLADGHLQASVDTASGIQTISSDSSDRGQWLKVGVHVRDGKLQLGINGQTYETTLTDVFVPDSSYDLIQIGGQNSQSIEIASLTLIDWSGIPMLELDSPDGTYVVQDDGYARVGVRVPAVYIALNQQRAQQRLYEHYADSWHISLIPSAYAGDFDDCVLGADPVEEAGFSISAGWAMINSINQCYLPSKIEQVIIEYQTADGVFKKDLILHELIALKVVYHAIALTSGSVQVTSNCAAGVLSGDMDNGTMATCSILSSFLLIGDVRDLSYQGWYWFIDDQENFSPMEATFASLGILGGALTATGAGAEAGVTLKAVMAVAKIIPKAFKGAKFLRPLASFINDQVLVKDYSKALAAMNKIMPFMEVATFVGFTSLSDEGKPIRDFMSNAINSSQDLDAWITYLKKMSVAIADGLIAENHLSPSDQVKQQLYAFVTHVLINQAYAGIVDDLQTVLVKDFIKIIEKAMEPPVTSEGEAVAKAFSRTLEALDKAKADGIDYLADIQFEPETLKALVNISINGGEETLRRLRNFGGLRPKTTNPQYWNLLPCWAKSISPNSAMHKSTV